MIQAQLDGFLDLAVEKLLIKKRKNCLALASWCAGPAIKRPSIVHILPLIGHQLAIGRPVSPTFLDFF